MGQELLALAEASRLPGPDVSEGLVPTFRDLLRDYQDGIPVLSKPTCADELRELATFLAERFADCVPVLLAGNDVAVQQWRERSHRLLLEAINELCYEQSAWRAQLVAHGQALAEVRTTLKSALGALAAPIALNREFQADLSAWQAERQRRLMAEEERRCRLRDQDREQIHLAVDQEHRVPEEASKKLSEVWVTPLLSPKNAAQGTQASDASSAPLLEIIEKSQRQDSYESRAWVGLGEPRAGKTSLVHAFKQRFLDPEGSDGAPLPIFIRLSEWEDGDP